MFAYYFRQTVPEGEIPMEEFETIVASAEDSEQFEEHLRELSNENRESGRSQAHNFLKRFKEHAVDIEHPQEVVNVLFALSDHLIETDPPLNSLDRGNRSHLFQTIHEIAAQAEDPTGLLKSGIQQNGSSCFASYFIGLLLQEHGENGGNKRHERNQLLPREGVTELQQEWVTQIEQRAQAGSLSDTPNLDRVLNRWKEWGSAEDAIEWTQQYASDDESLLSLLEQFIKTGRSSRKGETEYIDPEWIDPFINQSEVEDRLESLDPAELTQRQKAVVDLYSEGVKFRESGKDPSEFETWIFDER